MSELSSSFAINEIVISDTSCIGLLQIASKLGIIKDFSEVVEKLKELKFRIPKGL